VRDIGDEIAAHAVETVELRDILDLHEATITGVGNDMNRQHAVVPATGAQDQRPVEVGAAQIGDELRLADKIGDRLAAIGPHDKAQLHLGGGIAKENLILSIEQHHAVGQRLPGGYQHGNFFVTPGDPGAQVLFMAIESGKDRIPGSFARQRIIDNRRP